MWSMIIDFAPVLRNACSIRLSLKDNSFAFINDDNPVALGVDLKQSRFHGISQTVLDGLRDTVIFP